MSTILKLVNRFSAINIFSTLHVRSSCNNANSIKNGRSPVLTLLSSLSSARQLASYCILDEILMYKNINSSYSSSIISRCHLRNIATAFPIMNQVSSGDHFHVVTLSEDQFHKIADNTLESIYDAVSDQFDSDKVDPHTVDDAEYAQGVLTIKLSGTRGTFVLNTQTPNRQIWMSSPVSGPWRYDWDPQSQMWISTRDGHSLRRKLDEELCKLCNVRIPLIETD